MTGFFKDKMTKKVIVAIISITFAYIWPLADALSAESAKQIRLSKRSRPP